MVTKLKSVFFFYRRFLLSSIFVNFLLLVMGIEFMVSAAIKSLFLGLILWDYLHTRNKSKLIFYYNLNISPHFLFGLSLFLDLLILLAIYKITGYVY